MAISAILEMGLIVSISAIVVVSLFTLYFEDRLFDRVESLEKTISDQERESVELTAINETSPQESENIVAGKPAETVVVPLNEKKEERLPEVAEENEEPILKEVEEEKTQVVTIEEAKPQDEHLPVAKVMEPTPIPNRENVPSESIQLLLGRIMENKRRIDLMINDGSSTNSTMEGLNSNVNEKIHELDEAQRKISQIAKRLDLTEDTVAALMRRIRERKSG